LSVKMFKMSTISRYNAISGVTDGLTDRQQSPRYA